MAKPVAFTIVIPVRDGQEDQATELALDIMEKLFPEHCEMGELGEIAHDELDLERGEYRVHLTVVPS